MAASGGVTTAVATLAAPVSTVSAPGAGAPAAVATASATVTTGATAAGHAHPGAAGVGVVDPHGAGVNLFEFDVGSTAARKRYWLTTDDLRALPSHSQSTGSWGCGRPTKYYRSRDLHATALRKYGAEGLAKKQAKRLKREAGAAERNALRAAKAAQLAAARAAGGVDPTQTTQTVATTAADGAGVPPEYNVPSLRAKRDFFLGPSDLLGMDHCSQRLPGRGRPRLFYREADLNAKAIEKHGVEGLMKKRAARERRQANKRKKLEELAAELAAAATARAADGTPAASAAPVVAAAAPVVAAGGNPAMVSVQNALAAAQARAAKAAAAGGHGVAQASVTVRPLNMPRHGDSVVAVRPMKKQRTGPAPVAGAGATSMATVAPGTAGTATIGRNGAGAGAAVGSGAGSGIVTASVQIPALVQPQGTVPTAAVVVSATPTSEDAAGMANSLRMAFAKLVRLQQRVDETSGRPLPTWGCTQAGVTPQVFAHLIYRSRDLALSSVPKSGEFYTPATPGLYQLLGLNADTEVEAGVGGELCRPYPRFHIALRPSRDRTLPRGSPGPVMLLLLTLAQRARVPQSSGLRTTPVPWS